MTLGSICEMRKFDDSRGFSCTAGDVIFEEFITNERFHDFIWSGVPQKMWSLGSICQR
jgi:hypothetical protein